MSTHKTQQAQSREIRKQISFYLPVRQWSALRQEAAQQQIPITELCARLIRPEAERLRALTARNN